MGEAVVSWGDARVTVAAYGVGVLIVLPHLRKLSLGGRHA